MIIHYIDTPLHKQANTHISSTMCYPTKRWEIEILKENHTEFIKKLKELELPKYRLENESYK